MGAGDWERQGASAASAVDGDGDQRNFESAAAVAAGADGRGDGAGGGGVGDTIAGVCDGTVSFDCDDGGDVRGRIGALGGGGEHEGEERYGQRSQPRCAVFKRIDCGGWNFRIAGNCDCAAAGSGDFKPCAALVFGGAGAAVACGSVCAGAEIV